MRFIEGFSIISFPIPSLQRKGKLFKWIVEFQNSFEKLKKILTTTPVLRVADPNKELEVFTNASKESVGASLSQEGIVVSYESRKLTEHEQRYLAYDLELTEVVHAL